MQNCAEIRLGRFELIRELTRGLNSTVYLARDPEIERTVIIKLFAKGLLTSQELSDRVRSVNELSHVGIAKIFDLGYAEPGNPFLVMEFVEGRPLENVLTKGKLPEAEALGLTLDLLTALSCAHAHGVGHHNLKPSSLIVTREGHLKLTDFVASRRSGATPFTAPERLKGNGDERSDLFAVGVILYLMLSGFRPFQGNTEATIGFKLVHQHPVPVAAMDLELSPELDLVIGRFLAKNPDERYQTAEEALRDIASIRNSKEAGSAISQRQSSQGASLDLMEALGFRTGTPRSKKTKHSANPQAAVRLWKVAIPTGIALAGFVTVMNLRPYVRPTSPAPVLAVHIEVPSVPPTRHETSSKPRSVTARSYRAAAKSSRSEPVSPKTAVPQAAIPPETDVSPYSTVSPKVEVVAVPIELRQPFRECLMSIWVDEKLAYKNHIRAEKKSRFLHMGSSNADYLTLVEIPAGSHSLRVEVNGLGENYDATGSLSATFSKTNEQRLRVTAEKSHAQLNLQLD